jgi:hypothetical protein
MRLSRRVALGGVQLDEIHERIVIRGVDTGVPKETVESVNRMGGAGSRITRHHWETLEVSVTFAIDVPKSNMALRREIWEDVVSWAQTGGWLTAEGMDDRRMWAEKAVLPGGGDLWEWLSEYTIVFRAYGVPFWQDVEPRSVGVRGVSSWTGTIGNPGHFETVADVTFHNSSAQAMTSFAITVGGNQISLSGFTLAAGADLIISHSEDGLLRITAGGVSIYDKRSADSADDLYVAPGTAAISMTAGKAGTLTVSVYGRYA